MSQSLVKIYVHIVFHVKYEITPIPEKILPELYSYLGGICKKCASTPVKIGGTNDHVHILLTLPKNLPLSELIKKLKSNSSSWIKKQSTVVGNDMIQKFQWQSGYGAFSVSESQLPKVRQYIANQEEHHRIISFKEEYLAFLKKHNVDFDEQYLWN